MAPARHCQLAELAAILGFSGVWMKTEKGKPYVRIQTENLSVARKCFTLLRKTFNIRIDVSVRRHGIYQMIAYDGLEAVEHVLIQNSCCRRAFIRGAFLAAGSVSDPEKSYHFEIVCDTEDKARQLQEMIASFAIGAKIIQRKKNR